MWEIILAASPIFILILLLTLCKLSGGKSSIITLIITTIIVIFAFHVPYNTIGNTLLAGITKACITILSVIWMAVFSYNILLASEKIEILKNQLAAISTDKSVQVLLVTWGFGSLLEGMAGYGTSVAIPAAILISLGFQPKFAILISLIANSEPTTFGAVGIAELILAEEANCTINNLCIHTIQQLWPFIFLVPITLTILADHHRAAILKNIFLGLYIGSISYVIQFFTAFYLGPELPAILSGIGSILGLLLWSKWHPKKKQYLLYTSSEIRQAWSVYGLIVIFILANTIFKFTHVSLLLFGGAFAGGVIQGLSSIKLMGLLKDTFIQIRSTCWTVISLVCLSALMEVSGMLPILATTLTTFTGQHYPFFAPFVGGIGTFLTGSGTSSNILFGKLQANIALQIDSDPSWLASANTTGTTAGKIISPQSIAIATSACKVQGEEGNLLKAAFPYALVYVILLGLIVAYC